jgi:hypothetical protein
MVEDGNEFDAAVERAERRRREEPFAVAARYDRRIARVMIRLNTGIEIAFSPRNMQGLERAKPGDLQEIEISPSGYGLHFPRLEADLYIPGLLDGVFGSRRWLAARAEAAGEKSRNASKTAAE